MGVEQRVTYCRICEAYCGLVADVENGRLQRLRPDKDHPLSRGYACPKGIAMADVHNHPERVLHPLRRTPDGTFERTNWESALDDIATRTRAVLEDHGGGAVGWYMGNPGAFSYSHALWVKGFLDALGTPHYYSAGSQDVNNRFAASALLYDSPLVVPIPDLNRTRLLLMIGANPLVSHGSLLSAPRIREQLKAIVDRGGRIVVADPRRTETAAAFEHLPVRPDTDAQLLLSLLHVIFDEGLEDTRALRRQTRGADQLRAWAAAFPPEQTAALTGVDARTARRLARDLAEADGAAVYGRTGSCLGRHGTLVAFLLDALNAVTGNLDRPGGAVFGSPPVALDRIGERLGLATYGKTRSRIGDFPDVIGNLPASLMAREITEPGDGQLRALFVSAGNPVVSVPDGNALTEAFGRLDLLVSLDFFVNETNRHADYILPTTTFLERDDIALASLAFFPTPFIQHTDPVVAPAGEARQEWDIVEDLSRRLDLVPSSLRLARRLRVRVKPQTLLELLLRAGRLSTAKLRRHPHGIVLGEHVKTGVMKRRVDLAPEAIGGEIRRLATQDDPAFPLRLIGLRHLRAHNSWMNNVPKLTHGRSALLRINPADAPDAEVVRLESAGGALEVPILVTDEVMPGVVALPHGYGAVNVNLLASSAPEDLEPLAGMAHLNGIPVRVTPLARPASRPADGAARGSSPLQTAP